MRNRCRQTGRQIVTRINYTASGPGYVRHSCKIHHNSTFEEDLSEIVMGVPVTGAPGNYVAICLSLIVILIVTPQGAFN